MGRSHVRIEPNLGKCNWELAYNMVEIDPPVDHALCAFKCHAFRVCQPIRSEQSHTT